MNGKFFVAILLMFASLQACASDDTERSCLSQRLKEDGEWGAVSFTDAAGKVTQTSPILKAAEFTPVRRLLVRDGILYAETWGAEPLPAAVTTANGEILITPRYLDWLGTGSSIDAAARKVSTYAKASVKHRLRLIGRCQSSQEMLVEIRDGEVPKGIVKLRRTPRSPQE